MSLRGKLETFADTAKKWAGVAWRRGGRVVAADRAAAARLQQLELRARLLVALRDLRDAALELGPFKSTPPIWDRAAAVNLADRLLVGPYWHGPDDDAD